MKSNDENKSKSDEKKNEEKIRKQIEKLQICPYCQSMVQLIWVHGHYQCPKCKYVVTSCCGDS